MAIAGTRSPPPQFICIGPGNSATTWLADQLKLQRDVWMPPIQEASYLLAGLHYCTDRDLRLRWDWWSVVKRLVRNKSLLPARDVDYLRVARELARRPEGDFDAAGYQRLFAPAGDEVTGDIAPIYANMSVDRIDLCRPVLDGKRIFMVARDPVRRFWGAMSRYAQLSTFGEVDYGSVATARRLFEDPVRSLQHFPSLIHDRWTNALGSDSLKIFYFQQIRENPEQAYSEICAFIGADPAKRLAVVPIALNRKRKAPRITISNDAREWIRLAFQEELERCVKAFGAFGLRWQERHSAPPGRDLSGVASH